MTQTSLSLVASVDHIMIRVDDASYAGVFSLFTETLQLPISWDIQNHYPPFKAGGVVAGNISMEIFRSGQQPLSPGQAQFYGIALEAAPLPESLRELARRGIPHLPPYAIPQGYLSNRGSFYTLVYLGELLGGDLSAFFSADQMGLGAIDALIFDRLFQQGTVFLCEYQRDFWDIPQERLKKRALLQEKHGGSLGLEEVQSLIIGTPDLARAEEQWQRLLAPREPASTGLWRFKEGPAIRLVPHTQDGLLAMTWKVRSLAQARAFLLANGMLGEATDSQLTIAPEALYGLRIYVVE